MSRPWIVRAGACAFLALLTLTVYLPVWHYPYINYDDPDYAGQNPIVKAGLTWAGIKWAFTTMSAGNWHPLTWLSLMLDSQLFGSGAGGHHLVNATFHAANAVLLYLLLWRLTRAPWQSAIIAALFAWHPLRVESVAWVSERKDVLSTLFGLLCLIAYAHYAQGKRESSSSPSKSSSPKKGRKVAFPSPLPSDGRGEGQGEVRAPGQGDSANPQSAIRNPRFYYWLALLLFALGLMSKPMLVTLPFAMLLLDYWPLQRFNSSTLSPRRTLAKAGQRLLFEKIPFFLLAAAACVITFAAQKHGGAVMTVAGMPIGARMANALISCCRYLGKTFWPANLAVFYPMPGHWPVPMVLLAGALLSGITLLFFRARRGRPYLMMGWLWFLGTLVPVIGLVQVGEQAMADRYTYLPQIGVFIAAVFGVSELTKKLPLEPVLVVPVTSLVLAGCLLATAHQLQYWRNGQALFEHTVAVTRDNPIAQDKLGLALVDAGWIREAMEHYQEALRLKPDFAPAYEHLGRVLAQTGDLPQALLDFQEATRLDPNDAQAHNSLGNLLLQISQAQEAITQYQQALRLQPDSVMIHNNLGVALARTGNLPEAIRQHQDALRLQPDSFETRCDLGFTLVQAHQLQEAITNFERALELEPNSARAHDGLGLALLQNGQAQEAIIQFQSALQSDPGFVSARNDLGRALIKYGYILFLKRQGNQAIAPLQAGLKINPDDAEAYDCLGFIFLGQGKAGDAAANFQSALTVQSNNADAQNYLAWILATCPDASLRNGCKALDLAKRANQVSNGENPVVLDTLAAAYAETGAFDNAVSNAELALKLAGSQNQSALAQSIRQQLEYYCRHQSFRDPALTAHE